MTTTWRITRTIALAGLTASAVSCGAGNALDARMNAQNLALSRQAPKRYDTSANPVTKPLDIADQVFASAERGPRLVERLTMTNKQRSATADAPGFSQADPASRVVNVRYEAESARVNEVLGVLIAGYLERDYVMDPNISELVSLSIDEEMTVEEIERFVSGLCALYGLSLSEEDGRFTVRKAKAASETSPGGVPVTAPIYAAEPLLGNELPAIRLRKLRFTTADRIKPLLVAMMSEGSLVSTLDNMLVMVDTTRQIKRLSSLIAALDVPAFENTELLLYRLHSISAADAVTRLTAISTATKIDASMLSFVEMPEDQQLLVIARDPSVSRQAENLIRLVDRPAGDPARGRYIYTAQHTSADSLVDAFQNYFPDRMEENTGDPSDSGVRFVSYAPSGPSLGVGSVGGGSGGSARKVLIYATPDDYQDIVTLFAELDRPPQQVNMRVVIAEVTLTDELTFGVEYFLNALDSEDGNIDLVGTPADIASSTGSLIFTATDGFAVIEAIDNYADTRLLSSPTISAVHGGEAVINVGGDEPIPTGNTSNENGTVTSVDRRETGVTVNAQPFINEQGEIRISLQIEIAEIGVDNGPDLGRSFTTRILETDILTKHGQTFLLGGIIIDQETTEESKIPLLGDLPFIGSAFGTTTDRTQRTELLIAVTATIANTPGDADVFLSDYMSATHAVREALGTHEEDFAQGFLFNRVTDAAAAEPAGFEWQSPAEDTADAGDPAGAPEQAEDAEPSIESTLPPFIRNMLKGAGGPAEKPEGGDGG